MASAVDKTLDKHAIVAEKLLAHTLYARPGFNQVRFIITASQPYSAATRRGF
ncbi:hypothetical protein D3C75_608390 [compost metagenome]